MATDAKLHKNILLLTDDQNAIEEAHAQFPQYNWMYFNRTRFRGTEGGWENHFPTGDPKQEIISILSTFNLIKQCDSMAMTHGSFANFMLGIMRETHGDENVTVAHLGHR